MIKYMYLNTENRIKFIENILKFHLTDENRYFNGKQSKFEDAEFVIFGVPFDCTSTYRIGSRYAPQTIRTASINIETYSFRTSIDALNLKMYDAGDIPLTTNLEEILERISEILNGILQLEDKKVIVIGGEHTITYGVAKTLRNTSFIIFDAHMDLREEYPQKVKLSHATFVRRIIEDVGVDKISLMGIRAACEEEIIYARENGVIFKTSMDIMNGNLKDIAIELKKKIRNDRVWLSIDVDVLDPSIAPGVANPEPEGITMTKLLDLIHNIVMLNDVVGFDVVEVAPTYDNGITSIVAAKIILEIACMIKMKKS